MQRKNVFRSVNKNFFQRATVLQLCKSKIRNCTTQISMNREDNTWSTNRQIPVYHWTNRCKIACRLFRNSFILYYLIERFSWNTTSIFDFRLMYVILSVCSQYVYFISFGMDTLKVNLNQSYC